MQKKTLNVFILNPQFTTDQPVFKFYFLWRILLMISNFGMPSNYHISWILYLSFKHIIIAIKFCLIIGFRPLWVIRRIIIIIFFFLPVNWISTFLQIFFFGCSMSGGHRCANTRGGLCPNHFSAFFICMHTNKQMYKQTNKQI